MGETLRNQDGSRQPITGVLIDPNPVTNAGLKSVLEEDPQVQLKSSKALSSKDNDVDFIICTVNIFEKSSYHWRDKVKKLDSQTHLPIMVVSYHDEPSFVIDALECGASGFLPQSAASETLIEGCHLLVEYGVYLDHHYVLPLCNRISGFRHPETLPKGTSFAIDHEFIRRFFTKREIEIFELLVMGTSTEKIAKQLFISLYTLRNHLKNMLRKTKTESRTSLVSKAYRLKWVVYYKKETQTS
ncbi:response regulator transcription factor [Tuberibacillus sp. Marseille-P3662]|uniref:response regulator transcription factor n=1 Tax=Tuberibacillus sp. Marseille-P3662 TaxID=1965358 RepID=UPI000A1CAB59|nr:response regulator transcription factor [Tuberibacillus sp. Marseille-P3662]